ncbi:MAG: hypothetical protein QNJ17_04250 [Desulfocapsaceae bacterium]|nr:hypothetical protein [Desulfocapsaceae bacterium]
MISKVSPLQKISLSLLLESLQLSDNEDERTCFTFIYGAGSKGLSPFELDLSGKMVGEKLKLAVARDEMVAYLGHLYAPLMKTLMLPIVPAQLAVEVTVSKIEQPQEREIITAMKDFLGGGCGGGCDCGCH